jgi:hypothetical protein
VQSPANENDLHHPHDDHDISAVRSRSLSFGAWMMEHTQSTEEVRLDLHLTWDFRNSTWAFCNLQYRKREGGDTKSGLRTRGTKTRGVIHVLQRQRGVSESVRGTE